MAVFDRRPCPCGSGLRLVRCCQLDGSSLASATAMKRLTPLVREAEAALGAGERAKAEALCHDILELAPGQIEALKTLQQICASSGRQPAAEALVRRIVAFDPNNVWALNDLALRLRNTGALAKAEVHARDAIRVDPENAHAHSLMGMILTEANRPKDGEYHYRRVLELLQKPDASALANLAWNMRNQGRRADARALFEKSLALAPDSLQALLGWARLEEDDRNFVACAQLLDRAEKAAPNNPSVNLARAVLHGRMREPEKALALLDRMTTDIAAGTLRPEEFPETGQLLDQMNRYRQVFTALQSRNMCDIYRRTGRLDEAVAAGKQAIELEPNDPHSRVNLAIIYYACCEFEKAAACCEHALALAPRLPAAHFVLAECLLVRGEFERGWEEYEWRGQVAGADRPIPKTDRPPWDGKPVDGTLLLIADQGFGDVIQFSRFLPWAQSVCPDLVVVCSREMHAILCKVLPGARIVDRWDMVPPFACYSTLSSLPRVYGVRGDNMTGAPYLRADPKRVARWRDRLDARAPRGSRRIGLVWAGRPTHNNDFNRSVAFSQLAPLADLDRTVLVSLQMGPAQSQIGNYVGKAPLLDLGPELNDYEDTMAVVEGLDLLVSVDTSTVHLAGAMGKSVWVMLPFAPDWRWFLGRSDSPWYSSVRLFRQPGPGQWAPVVEAIASNLRQTASGAPIAASVDA